MADVTSDTTYNQATFHFIRGTMHPKIKGLIAATYTPFTESGELNLGEIPAMVEHLLRWKIAGLYVLGSTGEGCSLLTEERIAVAQAFIEAAGGRVPVIVQVGSECLKQSQLLAAEAERMGAAAISAVAPVYFKPDSVDCLVESMASIARAAPSLPFYYYHIPAATGVPIAALDFLRAAEIQIPSLRGIKFTSAAIHEYQACLEYAEGSFDILYGQDEMLLAGLSAGAQGAVGSTYNYAAPIYHALIQALEQGRLTDARKFQSHSQALVRAFIPFGPRGAQKEIMRMVGNALPKGQRFDCGPPRLPIMPLTEANRNSLREALQTLGFFRWIGEDADEFAV
ncbi:MAG: dihydrodipicolinate synthase family protein [Pirellulaceae bacterium]